MRRRFSQAEWYCLLEHTPTNNTVIFVSHCILRCLMFQASTCRNWPFWFLRIYTYLIFLLRNTFGWCTAVGNFKAVDLLSLSSCRKGWSTQNIYKDYKSQRKKEKKKRSCKKTQYHVYKAVQTHHLHSRPREPTVRETISSTLKMYCRAITMTTRIYVFTTLPNVFSFRLSNIIIISFINFIYEQLCNGLNCLTVSWGLTGNPSAFPWS